MSKCGYVREDGSQCGAKPMRGSDRCWHHQEKEAEGVNEKELDVTEILANLDERVRALEDGQRVLAGMITEKREIKAGWEPMRKDQYPGWIQDAIEDGTLRWVTVTPAKSDKRTINLLTVEFREGVTMEVPSNFARVAAEAGIL